MSALRKLAAKISQTTIGLGDPNSATYPMSSICVVVVTKVTDGVGLCCGNVGSIAGDGAVAYNYILL